MIAIKSSSLLIIFMFLLFAGCTKEKPQTEIQLNEGLDRVNDIAGFLNGFDSTLYVLPESKDGVIKILNANPYEGNRLRLMANTISGKNVSLNLAVKETTLPLILFYIGESEKSYLDILHDRDTARGELINRFKDSKTGVFYRVYKNARCVNVTQSHTTDCYEDIRWTVDPLDSTIKTVRTGKYLKMEQRGINHCLKGTDYCVEALVVSRIRHVYDDPLCRNLVGISEWGYDYSCLIAP